MDILQVQVADACPDGLAGQRTALRTACELRHCVQRADSLEIILQNTRVDVWAFISEGVWSTSIPTVGQLLSAERLRRLHGVSSTPMEAAWQDAFLSAQGS